MLIQLICLQLSELIPSKYLFLDPDAFTSNINKLIADYIKPEKLKDYTCDKY